MILNPKDGSRYESCVRRIRASWEARGVPEGRAVAIAEHHVASVADMNRVVSAAQRASDKLGSIKLKDRRHLANMVRKLYGTSRRVTEEDWPMAFAAVAERYVGEGVDRASVLAALEACWDALPHELHDVRFAAVLEFVENEEGKPRMNTDEHGLETNTRNTKVESGSGEEVNTKSTKKASGVKRRALSVKASSASIDKPSPLEVFTWNRAQEQLRFALAGLDPIVKRCVSLRLLRQDSFKKLAEELEVSLDEVREILTCLRTRVHKYTTYFDRDWYWDESAKRFTLPEAM